MKPNHFLSLLGIVMFTAASKAGGQTNSWFPGMLHPPAVTVALPTNFVIVSASPATKETKQFDMYDGVIWSTPRTAHQFEFGADHKFSNAQEPIFWVHLSDNVGQKPGTDAFTNEKDLVVTLSGLGLKKVKSAKTKWGAYPVLSMTGERPDGSPAFAAWIGINSPDGWTILVDYRVPKGAGHPTKEETRIWETFLNNTKPQ